MIYSLRHTVSESTFVFLFLVSIARTRGGVEDTMLEAKDTKKSRGQGQPFWGQTLSNRQSRGQRPRTRDTGASFQKKKKKGLQKSFSSDLQFKGVPRIFGWGRPKPQITCNKVIKIFPKMNFLWDKEMEWKIWNRWQLAGIQDFAKGEGLN